MHIRKIEADEVNAALTLVLEVFMEYEAPDYSADGVETFKRTGIENPDYVASLLMYGAYDDGRLVGVIATRRNGTHIALFFVKGDYHRKGIGRALFDVVLTESKADNITVNSSPYAREVYHRLGFVDTGAEQTVGGVCFYPMIYKKGI
eukprot:JZ549211.1.p1 GENE.JZ549211.1~~JZ549211.1.p1  ORF type:complete len:148 (+),score=3.44 JZ549211.1:65-508(+)